MPFILLYAAKYTLQDVHVISRINSGQWHSWNKRLGQVEAWVVRFVRSLRLENYTFNIDNMEVVKHKIDVWNERAQFSGIHGSCVQETAVSSFKYVGLV